MPPMANWMMIPSAWPLVADEGKIYSVGMPSIHSRPGRVCPGRHMADASVWASIASLLSVFDFKKARDAEGKEINITPMFSDSGLRQATHICMVKSCCLTLHYQSSASFWLLHHSSLRGSPKAYNGMTKICLCLFFLPTLKLLRASVVHVNIM